MAKTSEENLKAIEEFIHLWTQFSQQHPEIELGQWLRCFAIMTGLSMYMGDMADEVVDEAIDQMAEITIHTFENADQHVSKGTLQ